MDTTFMTDIIASGTTAIQALVGALFTYIVAVLPLLLGLLTLGLVVWGIRKGLRAFHKIR